jgi:sortase (surface protein transpeptidase)
VNKFTKQCVAAFASLAMAGTLCVAGAVVANNVAFATGNEQAAAKPAPWSDQGKNLKGSITVKKYEDKGANNTSTPLPGAKFKVQRVTKFSSSDAAELDLTKYENWETLAAKVKALNANPEVNGMQFDSANTQEDVTGTDGSKKFDKLAIGLYKVEETQPAPNHSNDVAPFYMTIPEITHEANKPITYSYDVSVSPKNQSLAGKIKKTLVHGDNETSFVGSGDTMTYKISAAVTSNTDTERSKWTKDDLKGYTVFDQAPKDVFTSYKPSDVVKSVKLVYKNSGQNKSEDLLAESVKEADTKDSQRIKVSFQDVALTKIATAAKADPDAKVEIEFAFTIKDPTKVNETSFTNKSGFIPGQGNHKPVPTPEVPDDPGSKVESKYGFLQVNKYDGTDSTKNTKVVGAKFKLFAKKNDADKCAADTNATECGNASKVGELVTIAGGKFANPVKVVIDDSTHPFYLVETEAPANYERDRQAHVVKVLENSTKDIPTAIDVANVPTKDHNWFNLPKTGAAGVIIFALAGMCLVAVGMFIFLRNRKKDEEQQNA